MNETPDDPEADNRLALLIRDSVADRTLPAGFAARVSAAASAATRRQRRRRVAAFLALALVLGAAAGAVVALGRPDGAAGAGCAVARRAADTSEKAVGVAPLAGVIEASRRRRRRDRRAEDREAADLDN